jgi:hypothetical protein
LPEVAGVGSAGRWGRRWGFPLADYNFVVLLEKHRLWGVVVFELFAKEKRQVLLSEAVVLCVVAKQGRKALSFEH